VYVLEALRRADHPPKESYRLSKICKTEVKRSFMEVGQGPNWGCSAKRIKMKCSKRQPRRCSVKIQTFGRVLHPIITDRCRGTDIMSTFYSHSTCIPDYGNRYFDDMLPVTQQSCTAPRRCDRFKSYMSLHVFLISCRNLLECKQKSGILKSYETNYRSIKKGKAIRVTGREGP
jgi:hypothetical protein